MLKRIHVQHLSLGMYIHEFCGSWMEHPFWRTRFLLQEAADLQRILASNIHEVWINTAKGLDVPEDAAAVSREQADAAIERELLQADTHPAAPTDLAATPIAVEIERATQICANGKQAVLSMFNEARMGQAIAPTQAQALVDEISASVTRNPQALISLARLKTADDYTYLHSVAVSALMVALARQLGMKEEGVRLAGMAGLLHDLGKAHIPLGILNKPGKLTDAEFDIIRSHPRQGHGMLAPSQLPALVMDACLHHHEKIDGSGYPDGLAGDQIKPLARMTAVCDVYDAITSNRPYKDGWDPSESLRRMAEWTHSHFDNRIFQAFVKAIGIYPVGSLLRLSCGHLAVVTEQSAHTLISPKVKLFYDTGSSRRVPPQVIDLAAPDCIPKIIAREDPQPWGFHDLSVLALGQAAALDSA